MTIKYVCRHCNHEVATLSSSISDSDLGLSALTEQERNDMVSYDESGNKNIYICCDYCYEAVTSNPDRMENNTLFH